MLKFPKLVSITATKSSSRFLESFLNLKTNYKVFHCAETRTLQYRGGSDAVFEEFRLRVVRSTVKCTEAVYSTMKFAEVA